jgi:carbon-monoxide dehydrogenase catalytic subunit
MEHHEFHPDNAQKKAKSLVKIAIESFTQRKGEVFIPVTPTKAVGGFSTETIVGALGGTVDPLIEARSRRAIFGVPWAL